MLGNFYAVGVGPGDPELLTIKAINTIKKCDIIAVPNSGKSENIALKIAMCYITDKTVVEYAMPMTKDEAILESSHTKAADSIKEYLEDGKSVAFLTLGDPTIYSTVMYVHKKLTNDRYNTFVVSGIPSFCAVAAALNTTLCEKNEMLHIIPATYSDIDEALKLSGTKALMKSGKNIMMVKDKLKDKKASMVECATMENEKIYHNLSDLKEESGYFSIVVVKE